MRFQGQGGHGQGVPVAARVPEIRPRCQGGCRELLPGTLLNALPAFIVRAGECQIV